MKAIGSITLLGALLLCLWQVPLAAAATGDEKWPEGCQPADVGRRIALNLLDRAPAKKAVGYPEVCTAYGSLRLAGTLRDKELLDKLVARYASMLSDDGKHLIPRPRSVDSSVFGVLPIEIYRQTEDQRYLTI